MSLKEDAKKKVPQRSQALPQFKIFLNLLDNNKFSSVAALRMFIDVEMASCKANITRSKASPTGQHHRRECTKHLALYKTIKERFLPYL